MPMTTPITEAAIIDQKARRKVVKRPCRSRFGIQRPASSS
jgi:hypothetical protein